MSCGLIQVNAKVGVLDPKKANAIVQAATEVADGKLMDNFPLVIWQVCQNTLLHITCQPVVGSRASALADRGGSSGVYLGPADARISLRLLRRGHEVRS